MNQFLGKWQSLDHHSIMKEDFFLPPHEDLNHGPLQPKASILTMLYTDHTLSTTLVSQY